jgi:hypothetical protein
MLKLVCKIEIKNKDNKKISFDYVNQIEVKTSCKNLTDTAVVKVPRKIRWRFRPLTDFISRGDTISIAAGYAEYGIETIFKGTITGVENGVPLVIRCENEMYAFKTINVPAEKIAKFDLKAYIEKHARGIQVEIPENLTFGSMDIRTPMTLAQALDAIMKTYPYVKGFFQDGVFRAVLNTLPGAGKRDIVFSPARNMVSDSLTYTRSEDVRIGIKAVSILRSNQVLEAYAPKEAFTADAKGAKTIKSDYEQRQFYCPQCTDLKSVQGYADKMAAEWMTDRMSGSFRALGVPYVRKSDIVRFADDYRPERNGKRFVVDAVDYTFGTSGYSQNITLGDRLK